MVLCLTACRCKDTIFLAESGSLRRPSQNRDSPVGRRLSRPFVDGAMGFFQKLARAAERNDSLLCVGLDPDPERLPSAAKDVAAFPRAIIEATCDLVCAYKPNLAFYEALGLPGLEALHATLAALPADLPVL